MFAGVIFYNDGPKILEKCLMSLVKAGIKPIAIDGAFKDFPRLEGEEFYSTDGCLEVAKEHSWKVIESPVHGWQDQVHKRNAYLEACPIGSYLMYIDADEILRQENVDLLHHLNEDAYRIIEHRHESNEYVRNMTSVRIYKIYNDLRYKYQHCRLYRLNNHIESDIDSGLVCKAHGEINMKTLLHISFDHYKFLRPKIRVDQKEKFYKERFESTYGY